MLCTQVKDTPSKTAVKITKICSPHFSFHHHHSLEKASANTFEIRFIRREKNNGSQKHVKESRNKSDSPPHRASTFEKEKLLKIQIFKSSLVQTFIPGITSTLHSFQPRSEINQCTAITVGVCRRRYCHHCSTQKGQVLKAN